MTGKRYFVKTFCVIFLLVFVLFSRAYCEVKAAGDSHVLRDCPLTKESLSKKNITIGEKFKYIISAITNKDVEVEFSDLAKDLGDFVIKDYSFKQGVFLNSKKITARYLLTTYKTGKINIPKIEIRYKIKDGKEWSKDFTSSPQIEVKSLLEAAGAKASLRDIKKPIDLYPKKIILIVLISLILLAIGWVTFRLFLKKKVFQKAEYIPLAHEIAYAQLEKLKNKNLIGKGMIKEYFIEVSDIIRHYLENRFNFKAPEMTTEEFLAYARDNSTFISEQKALLKAFLVCCDMVKFAKYAPLEEEITEVFVTAKQFIDQTKNELT